MQSHAIAPPSVPAAAPGYSPAVLAEGRQVLFISGQGPADLDADMETQFRQCFERIGTLVKEAGGGWGNVVMIRAYFLNMARDLGVFRKIRQEFLAEPYPASTAVGVTELAIPGLEFEIEAVAVL
jgi:enamine deaminase RidA (YjgF/YER057c/UK114 family)